MKYILEFKLKSLCLDSSIKKNIKIYVPYH
jgi:hypothetical protein